MGQGAAPGSRVSARCAAWSRSSPQVTYARRTSCRQLSGSSATAFRAAAAASVPKPFRESTTASVDHASPDSGSSRQASRACWSAARRARPSGVSSDRVASKASSCAVAMACVSWCVVWGGLHDVSEHVAGTSHRVWLERLEGRAPLHEGEIGCDQLFEGRVILAHHRARHGRVEPIAPARQCFDVLGSIGSRSERPGAVTRSPARGCCR